MKGVAMGMAEVVPGVSGGTIALITGIYLKLLDTIKSINFSVLKKLAKGEFSSIKQDVDVAFIFSLLGGMFIGIIVGVFAISYLLEFYPPIIWSFFFGLILASVLFVLKQLQYFDFQAGVGIVLGSIVAFLIVQSTPVGGLDHPLYIIFSGSIAISALMLPGISGSFILILLGMYDFIIPEVKTFLTLQTLGSFRVVFFFLIGCSIGVFAFSRWVSYCFREFKNTTLSLMSGFMLGSVYKIWPWKNIIESSDSMSLAKEINVMPNLFEGDPHLILSIVVGLFGFVFIFVMENLSKKLKWNNPQS